MLYRIFQANGRGMEFQSRNKEVAFKRKKPDIIIIITVVVDGG